MHSDVVKPKEYGIETALYERVASELRTGAALTPDILAFSQQHRLCELQLRSDPNYKADPDFDQKQMQLLGESLGALMLGSFTLWLAQRAKKNNIKHMVFFARDGWLPKEAWELMNEKNKTSNISVHYIYVSRKVLRLASGYLESRPDYIPDYVLSFLSSYSGTPTAREMLTNIGIADLETLEEAKKLFNDLDAPLNWEQSQGIFKDFLTKKSNLIYEILKKNYDNIIGYFKQEGILDYSKIGIMDMGWNGTMQGSFNQLMLSIRDDFECIGFYYGLWKWASGNRYLAGHMESAFFNEFDSAIDFEKNLQGIDIIEELNIWDEGTTTGFLEKDGGYTPINTASKAESQQYANYIQPFQRGALNTLNNILQNGKHGYLDINSLTIENARAAYRLVFLSPTNNEIKVLTKIQHGVTFDHKLVSISDLPIPQTVEEISKQYNMSWSVGAIRYWQISSNQNKFDMFREFSKSNLSFLTPRELKTFNRK